MTQPLLQLPPLSLYIHIPWCIKKCPYCDFNSHQSKGELPQQSYIEALIEDLKQDAELIQNRALHSIFIGGGTPSLFSAQSFDFLLNEIAKILPLGDSVEITLEANPGTFEQQKFSDFRKTGINRLSIGIQSFQTSFLKKLGRIHDGDEALRAADIARLAGFDNFNLDLMFALPQQTAEQALYDLEQAINCAPTHLSWYQLTIEPNTHFHSFPPALPDENALIEIQLAGQDFLQQQGFQQYEISAYSTPKKQSQHNLNYWQFGDYIGIGAGAHGKITQLNNNEIIRTRRTRQPNHYLDKTKKYCTEQKLVPTSELPLEFMMNAMRLNNGSDIATYESRTGLPFALIEQQIATLRHKKLLQFEQLAPTKLGLQYLNNLLTEFI